MIAAAVRSHNLTRAITRKNTLATKYLHHRLPIQRAMSSECPYHNQAGKAAAAFHKWWPNQLNLGILNQAGAHDPDPSLEYAKEFVKLDLPAVKKDIANVLTTSQAWWPADYGHYGPFMIRMAWHAAGTYRIQDGRGGANSGNIRFAPLNSWPDNGNLDKARRLLWPVKQKYGRQLSWADLMILTGNVALETMGFKTLGFAGGRADIYAPEQDVYWGSETTWLDDNRHSKERDLDKPLGATQMGLIYVNPEGPGGNSDPMAAAKDIRNTFGNMAMNDEETVALIAGGHTFGKAHGAGPPSNVGPEPEGAAIEEQGLGWKNSFGTGKGGDTITSGLEGAWTYNPIAWDNDYFEILFKHEWKQVKSPAGATQWIPTDAAADGTVPDAHDPNKRHAPIMLTTDLTMKMDPEFCKISKRFHESPQEFADAFAKAWYKLTHRDMGPMSRCLGSEVAPPQLFQDPIPEAPSRDQMVTEDDIAALKSKLLGSGLSISQLVGTAWASASTYRCTDHRGGANGARIRFAPQKDWAVNNPAGLKGVLETLESIQQEFNKESPRKISLADVIVLGGCAGVDEAAKNAGHPDVKVCFSPGRTDATLEQTDVDSFAVLEPKVDGFRNHFQPEDGDKRSPEELLVDRAHMLTLTAPEMTVLVGGLRVLLGDNSSSSLGASSAGKLSNDFYLQLLDMGTTWQKVGAEEYEGRDVVSGDLKYKASRVDLAFGSNSQLRAIAEFYACDDAKKIFMKDFCSAWTKVMNLDRFDLNGSA